MTLLAIARNEQHDLVIVQDRLAGEWTPITQPKAREIHFDTAGIIKIGIAGDFFALSHAEISELLAGVLTSETKKTPHAIARALAALILPYQLEVTIGLVFKDLFEDQTGVLIYIDPKATIQAQVCVLGTANAVTVCGSLYYLCESLPGYRNGDFLMAEVIAERVRLHHLAVGLSEDALIV